MALSEALLTLKLRTDKERLELPLPPKEVPAASFLSQPLPSYEETRKGSTVAMAAICAVYKDAMDFWNLDPGRGGARVFCLFPETKN